MRIAIIEAVYYKEISAALNLGVINTLKEDYGIEVSSITTYSVTGAYELPLVAKWALDAEQFDGIIALGCVIKGQTDHDAYINQSVFNHFTSLALDYGTPIINGVLTTNSRDQAWARAGGNDSVERKSHKGEDCAHALMEMIQLKSKLAK